MTMVLLAAVGGMPETACWRVTFSAWESHHKPRTPQYLLFFFSGFAADIETEEV
ncbi:MAG: hypothetical protein JW862_01250 [Anaerolineales bacterium]|nr:hypothetical protein [Anaerolineales bacterium]